MSNGGNGYGQSGEARADMRAAFTRKRNLNVFCVAPQGETRAADAGSGQTGLSTSQADMV